MQTKWQCPKARRKELNRHFIWFRYATVSLTPLQTSITYVCLRAYSWKCWRSRGLFALINSSMSLFEFLLNPLFGQISDAYGRRVVLLLWPPINAISRVLVAVFTSKRVYMTQQISVKMLEYIFEKGISCSITDLLTGDERSIANGQVNFMREGLGVLVGSLVGGYVTATCGHRSAYYLCALSSFFAYLLMQFRMVETLNLSRRKAVNMGQALNPFRFWIFCAGIVNTTKRMLEPAGS